MTHAALLLAGVQVVPGDLSAGHRAAAEAEHPALQPPPLYTLDPDLGEVATGKTTSTPCTVCRSGAGTATALCCV